MDDTLIGFSCSLNNDRLYIIGSGLFNKFNIKADDLTLLNSNEIITSKKELSSVTLNTGEVINGKLIQNSDVIATLRLEDSDILSTKFSQIISSDYLNFEINSKNKKELKLRLAYDNRFSYEIKTNIFSDFTINQRIILNSNLPYNLKDIPNFRISFQNQEVVQPQYYDLPRKMSSMALSQASPMPEASKIGLPIDLGEIDFLPKNSSIELPLHNSSTKLEVVKTYFEYMIRSMYPRLKSVVKSNKGNIYPSIATINDEDDLPSSQVNLPLYSEGVEFVIDMGNFPAINITTTKQSNETKRNTKSNVVVNDSYELKINFSSEVETPFTLKVKGYDLVKDYEFEINKQGQKINVDIKTQND